MLKTAILWPAIAQFVLIALCYVWLGIQRQAAMRSKAVPTTDFAPGADEPRGSFEARRHLANQFELPVLFFAVIGFLFAVDGVSFLELAVAWLYIVARVLHSVGALAGPLALRHIAFFAAFLLCTVLWIDLAIRII